MAQQFSAPVLVRCLLIFSCTTALDTRRTVEEFHARISVVDKCCLCECVCMNRTPTEEKEKEGESRSCNNPGPNIPANYSNKCASLSFPSLLPLFSSSSVEPGVLFLFHSPLLVRERKRVSQAKRAQHASDGGCRSSGTGGRDTSKRCRRSLSLSLSCTFFLWRRTLATVCGDCRDFAEQESGRTRSEAENQWGGSGRMERKDVWRERERESLSVVRVTR